MVQIINRFGQPVGRQEQHDTGLTFYDIDQNAEGLSPEDYLEQLQEEAIEMYEDLINKTTILCRRTFINNYINDHF